MSNTPKSTILGYPRIGPNRELKKAVEGYWAGKITAEALAEAGATIRAQTWTGLSEAGLDEAPSNTFSYYDQVLDTAIAVGEFLAIVSPRAWASSRSRSGGSTIWLAMPSSYALVALIRS